MARTIKELSNMCGVSEQAIRGWCRKNQIAKDAKGKGFAIDETTETAILLHYGAINAKDAKANETKDAKANESNGETMRMLKILQEELDFWKKQIEVKDEQIAILQKSLQRTTEALTSAQESVKAAQFFQANAEQKVRLVEQVAAGPDQSERPDPEEVKKTEKKPWWKRL